MKKSKDTQRLDWMIKHQATVKFYDGQWWVNYCDSQEVGAKEVDTKDIQYRKTPKAAIDSAMKSGAK